MSSEYLSPGEMHTLTGFARSGQQGEWLTAQGIPFLADGRRIIVSREHVRARMEGRIVARSKGLNMAGIK
jgi:Domain of unknown function (DUF4224)